MTRNEKCTEDSGQFIDNSLDYYLSLGYCDDMSAISQAASLLGRRSAQVRIKKWGQEEFERRMREWGKLGGRPGKKRGEK
jgi:hypothetical protein